MYPISLGSAFMVQQVISGTGVFDGSEFGRAKCQIPASTVANATVRMSAALYGSTANGITVTFLDMGAGTTVAATTAAMIGSQLTVTLRRNVSGILATAQEVSGAINALQGSPVLAVFDGTGTGIATATSVPVALNASVIGEDPALGPSLPGVPSDQFKWSRPVNTNGGFFYFEQQDVVIVRQIEMLFTLGATNHVYVKRVNLNSNLEPIAGEAITFFEDDVSPTTPALSVSDVRVLVHPFQAVQVITQSSGAPGIARIDVRREANFPYL